ncbi:ankyrin repeat-containing domain protein [Tuber brumale]|nr:ankyrin repeat-containing domain protein [Tuber brumale]
MPHLLSLPPSLPPPNSRKPPAHTLSRTIQTWKHLHRLLTLHPHKPAYKPRDSLPPLHWAASRGHTRLACHLVQSGQGPDAQDAMHQTRQHSAGLGGLLEVLQILLKAPGVSVHGHASGHGTCMRWLESGRLAYILVRGKGWPVERVLRHSAGGTPLHWTAWRGRVAAIRALVKAEARVGDLDGEGAGVLHWGMLSGKKEVIAVLVKGGGRDVLDLWGESAADLAAVAAGSDHRRAQGAVMVIGIM